MPKQRELSPEELKKPYAKYYDRPMTPPPQEVYDFLAKGPIDPRDALAIQNRNDILKPGYLPTERGWCVMPDGTAYASGLTKMPGVTAEMIAWWFAWHGLEDLRYMIWAPDDHYAVHVRPEDLEHRLDYSLSDTERNWGTTDVVFEDVGGGPEEINISFLSPMDYGYDMDLFKKKGTLIAVCATSEIATFSHVGRAIPGGIELRSRFWIGWVIRDRKAVRPDIPVPPGVFESLAKGLAHHCPKEYYNLAALLPLVYAENVHIRDTIEDFR